ncbi:hypothetical protein ACW7GZ_00910 [Luteimonas sp. A537]
MFLIPAVLLLAAASPPAWSVEAQTMAAGACKSALPIFDGNIRSRPLAVQNEGTSSAFVTCTQQAELGNEPRSIGISLINTGAAATTVNCTMVNRPLLSEYYPESIQVAAGAITWLIFTPSGAPTFTGTLHAFSCNLPPGTGVNRIAYLYD